MTSLSHERQLQLISKAWGRNQSGYCFFPIISGTAKTKAERIRSYQEGPAFLWPRDKRKILAHMAAHTNDDLYWCPSLFEVPLRKIEHAMDEHALWADLDKVDPHKLKDTQYEPTIAWETSPGKYQALWILSAGDIQGASWPGQENQRLTYYLEADHSGWDTTQLLRVPGWTNHKPEYNRPQGKLLWTNGRTYLCDDFTDLPEIEGAYAISEVLEGEVDRVDRHAVWARVRLKVTKAVRDYLSAREATGDRSNVLWQVERELADADCSVAEIVAIARASVWNKFAGRADELKRLTIEAQKAIAQRPGKAAKSEGDVLEEVWEDKGKPIQLFSLMESIKPTRWLVKDLFAEGTCGFIAGQPKNYKSWIALDLAFSVATGAPFLGNFLVLNPGRILYIQQEDAPPLLKGRIEKIWPTKQQIQLFFEDNVLMQAPPPNVAPTDVAIDAFLGQEFTISDEGWQGWLDEVLTETEYRMVILDPLMMMIGDVREEASSMTDKIFRPLKLLARKHEVAMIVVHHMRKGSGDEKQRGGQLMLGSVANHAWAEDSIYLRHEGSGVMVEHESKHGYPQHFRLGGLTKVGWHPIVTRLKSEEKNGHDQVVSDRIIEGAPSRNGRHRVTRNAQAKGTRSRTQKASPVHLHLIQHGPTSPSDLANALNISRQSVYAQLNRLKAKNEAERLDDGKWVAWDVKSQ